MIRLLLTFIFMWIFPSSVEAQDQSLFQVNVGDVDNPDQWVPALKIVAVLTLLTLAPAILLMMTSFTRILIVLGFVRQAIGTQTMPPNQILIGMAFFLTLFTMGPIFEHIYGKVYIPYTEKKINQEEAIQQSLDPIRSFMFSQTREVDIGLFLRVSGAERPSTQAELPLRILMPAFLISELRTAFQIGFLVYIPFLIIDMVVSSVLMAMGMLMLPPTVVSLPFKLVLFILVDGWSLIVEKLVQSFQLI